MKKIIVIGAGMGGLSAGIFGQANGFETEIFEHHTTPGGQACSWKRKGYTFDGCLHHFMGSSQGSRINALWKEVGVNPDSFIPLDECVSFWRNGKQFVDWYDTEKLHRHMLEIAPEDASLIGKYISDIKGIGKFDLLGQMSIGGILGMLKHPVLLFKTMKNMGIALEKFSKRFKSTFLRESFEICEYSIPVIPYGLHLSKKADGANGGIKWPPGGIASVAKSMASRYASMGGKLRLGKKVTKILVEQGKAIGVELHDGTKHYADYIISNADGRKTLTQLLDNRYTTEKLTTYIKPLTDETNWAFHVFLGVNRDLSNEPSSLHILLEKPVEIAGHTCKHLELQMFGFDKSMAPQGKGVIKVELFSTWEYCENLARDKENYLEAKNAIAQIVIDILENTYFKGLKDQVEAIDVPTLITWSRYLNSQNGFLGYPNRKMDILATFLGKSDTETLKSLRNFRFVGTWATATGALFANVLSGKKAIRALCRQEKRKFCKAG